MISLEECQKWVGFPWTSCQKWLETYQVGHSVNLWEPDERSQFSVNLNDCYVIQIRQNEDLSFIIEVAGKMTGRKEMKSLKSHSR